MSNVIQFPGHANRSPAKAQPATPQSQPKAQTQWEKDYEKLGEIPNYSLCAVLSALSVAYQTGKIKMGDKLLAECRKNAFDTLIPLNKELGDFLNDADFSIVANGVTEQQDAI
jgi:hypothetical protein